MTIRLVLATLVLGALVGCGDSQGADPSPHREVTADGSAVSLVDKTEADLLLFVSNQSFDDEEVVLSVTVDGVPVVDGRFHVEDQHNWVAFPLALPPGGHEITAKSDSGATLRKAFHTERNGRRYAVIDHWTDDGPSYLTWHVQKHPLAFA